MQKFEAKLCVKFCVACVLTATYIINMFPSKAIKHKMPYEIIFGKNLIIATWRFLSVWFMLETLRPKETCSKWQVRSREETIHLYWIPTRPKGVLYVRHERHKIYDVKRFYICGKCVFYSMHQTRKKYLNKLVILSFLTRLCLRMKNSCNENNNKLFKPPVVVDVLV